MSSKQGWAVIGLLSAILALEALRFVTLRGLQANPAPATGK